jgi:hypothetical protein
LSEVSLSDLELSILAWPLSERPAMVTNVAATTPGGPTERFQKQIDVGLLQRAVQYLRQEMERQQEIVSTTRRQLPKGWYRQSNPTFDLEVLSDGLSEQKLIDLPKIWPRGSLLGRQ